MPKLTILPSTKNLVCQDGRSCQCDPSRSTPRTFSKESLHDLLRFIIDYFEEEEKRNQKKAA